MLTTLTTFMHADSWPAEWPPVRPGNAHPSRGTCAWWPSPQSPDTALTAYVRVCAQIDFDEAVSARRIVIKPTVDEDLDRIKRTYFGLGDFLVRSTCARSCPRTGWAGVCFAPTYARGCTIANAVGRCTRDQPDDPAVVCAIAGHRLLAATWLPHRRAGQVRNTLHAYIY